MSVYLLILVFISNTGINTEIITTDSLSNCTRTAIGFTEQVKNQKSFDLFWYCQRKNF